MNNTEKFPVRIDYGSREDETTVKLICKANELGLAGKKIVGSFKRTAPDFSSEIVFECDNITNGNEELSNENESDFSWVLRQLKTNPEKRFMRKGWNGKGMWITKQVPDAHSKMTLPYIFIEYAPGHAVYPDGCRVPWLASQTDMLSNDWCYYIEEVKQK